MGATGFELNRGGEHGAGQKSENSRPSELKTKNAGLIADGGNLYLRTFLEAKDGTLIRRGWIFQFQTAPGRRMRGIWELGSLDSIGLAMARKVGSGESRELVAIGVDPIERRNEICFCTASGRSRGPCRRRSICVPADYIKTLHRSGWRNPKHAQQWNEYAEDLRIANHRQDAG